MKKDVAERNQRHQHDGQIKYLKLESIAKQYFGNKDDPEFFAIIKFMDRDSIWRTTIVPSSFLVTGVHRLIEHLGNRNYRRSKQLKQDCQALMFANTDRRAVITSVPGWHDGTYVLPDRVFRRSGEKEDFVFRVETNAGKRAPFHSCGSLSKWQEMVRRIGRYSSVARLFIALPFAATILKLVSGPSFGLVLVGGSSVGKTVLLEIAAAIMGHHSLDGKQISSLDSSTAGIEEMILAHRDGFLALDEMGHLLSDFAAAARYLKFLGYQATAGQSRKRITLYERQIGTNSADTRVVFGSTSEVPLRDIAQKAGQSRLVGEQVRLIEIPALLDGASDIFDRPRAATEIGKGVRERKNFVEEDLVKRT